MPLRNGNTFRDGNENNLLCSRFGLKFWGNRSAGRRAETSCIPGVAFMLSGYGGSANCRGIPVLFEGEKVWTISSDLRLIRFSGDACGKYNLVF